MNDRNIKEAWNQKRTYLKHLGNVETWLITVSKNPANITDFVKDTEKISKSCSYIVDNFDKEIELGSIGVDKKIMIVVGMLNALIRVYAIDKSSIITSQEYFQAMNDIFVKFLEQFVINDDEEDSLDNSDDDDAENSTDNSDSSPTKLSQGDLKRYIANIFDSLLTNFAQDDLLKKCLELYFPKKEPSKIGSDTTNEQCSMTDHRQPRETIIRILKQTDIFSSYVFILSIDEFSKKYESLSEDLCLFVDRFFADANNLSINNLSMEVIGPILNIVVSLSDKTPLVPMFVRAGYAEKTINWIGKLSFRSDTKALGTSIIVIIHNLARHKSGLRSLREHNAFEALMKCKPLLNLGPNVEVDNLTHAFGMALIALATSDSEQKENEEFIRKISDKLYSMCQEAADPTNKILRLGGYHLSELLISLDCAFSNTSIIRHILGDNKSGVRPEPIQFFAQLLASFYGLLFNQENDYLEEIIGKSLLRLLLCISNYEEYRKELTNHDQFCVLIEGLAKRSEQDAAKRICCNLKVKPYDEAPLSQLKTQKQPVIFISYHWDNIDLSAEFVDKLSEFTDAPVWIGYENIGWFDENKWDKIASAIQCATVIIVLVSSAYCQSIFNFQELNYAVTLSQSETKSFIFVELEPDTANKREWLSNLISNLSKEKEIISYNDNMHEMIQEIVEENTFLKKRALVTRLTDTVAQSRICTIM